MQQQLLESSRQHVMHSNFSNLRGGASRNSNFSNPRGSTSCDCIQQCTAIPVATIAMADYGQIMDTPARHATVFNECLAIPVATIAMADYEQTTDPLGNGQP